VREKLMTLTLVNPRFGDPAVVSVPSGAEPHGPPVALLAHPGATPTTRSSGHELVPVRTAWCVRVELHLELPPKSIARFVLPWAEAKEARESAGIKPRARERRSRFTALLICCSTLQQDRVGGLLRRALPDTEQELHERLVLGSAGDVDVAPGCRTCFREGDQARRGPADGRGIVRPGDFTDRTSDTANGSLMKDINSQLCSRVELISRSAKGVGASMDSRPSRHAKSGCGPARSVQQTTTRRRC